MMSAVHDDVESSHEDPRQSTYAHVIEAGGNRAAGVMERVRHTGA
jgi:hypothetical protein